MAKKRYHELEDKVTLPQEGDLFALVLRRLGGSWIEVQCSDGKIRKARLTQKVRFTRIYEGDIILCRPWYGIQPDTRADVIHKYSKNELKHLLKSDFAEELKKIIPEELLEEILG